MKRLSKSLALAILVTQMSCAMKAHPPTPRPLTRDITVPADFSRVWDATIDIFGERFWPIANMDRASGFIASEWMSSITSPEYLDCGTFSNIYGEQLDQRIDPTGKFNIVVREIEDGTILRVNTLWRSEGVNECVSTGELEQELHDAVFARLSESNRQ